MLNKYFKTQFLLLREDLEREAKKKSRWLDEDEEESCGFAIGRRIFEKAEIEVSILDTCIPAI